MKELDLTDKQLNDAMNDAYNENPNVGFFDTGFRKGFLFAKKLANEAKTSNEREKVCSYCKGEGWAVESGTSKPCPVCYVNEQT